VQRIADAQRRSAHWVMKEAIEEYLEREEKRAQFRQDALTALEDYETTGLHLTGSEVDEWLAKLERGEEAKMPAWHE
jgi:predicted transcriptional regulator